MTKQELQQLFHDVNTELSKSLTAEKLSSAFTDILSEESMKGSEPQAAIFAAIVTAHQLDKEFLFRILEKILVEKK